jgi:hypothetical protein
MIFEIIGAFAIFLLGALCLPLLLFLRARRDGDWDDSNITNMYRVVAHLAAHPSDFGKLQYPDGKKPFWYINKDELSDVVDARPEDE